MADPVCGLILSAAAAHVIDYTTFDRSRRFYLREHVLLLAHANALKAKSNELRLMYRGAAVQNEDAAAAVNTALRALMPWCFAVEDATRATFDDMVVAWYRVFGNFDQAKPP